jgi:hypothetical protein
MISAAIPGRHRHFVPVTVQVLIHWRRLCACSRSRSFSRVAIAGTTRRNAEAWQEVLAGRR